MVKGILMNRIIETIIKQFNISEVDAQRDNLVYVTVEQERFLSLLIYLKENEGMKHFVLLSAVDYIEDNLFQLTYTLNNPDEKFDIGVRVKIDRSIAEIQSAHSLWPTIATYQREIFEMYGINFPGSPGVDEQLMLEGWDSAPPGRRDFDTLKYAEETFFPREGRSKKDPKEYMKEKIYGEWEKGGKDV